jgi:hypothetical protein
MAVTEILEGIGGEGTMSVPRKLILSFAPTLTARVDVVVTPFSSTQVILALVGPNKAGTFGSSQVPSD